MSKAKTFKFSDSTVSILEMVGNATRYIEAIVRRSHGRWSAALNNLAMSGWTFVEILEAITALNAAWEGVDSPALHSATMSRHRPKNVPDKRWDRMQESVLLDPVISHALDILASEYWSSNTYLRQVLEDGIAGETQEVSSVEA